MDTLDELNAAIEGLCAIAERAREQALDDLLNAAVYGPATRGELRAMVMDVAEWTRSLDGYRGLLRPQQPGVRVVR